jgi:hypothetical protein
LTCPRQGPFQGGPATGGQSRLSIITAQPNLLFRLILIRQHNGGIRH